MRNQLRCAMLRSVLTCLACLLWHQGVTATPYRTWLADFKPLLQVGPVIDEREQEAIEDALRWRPEVTSGDYKEWIQLLESHLDVGPVLDDTEKQVLEYVLQAKPDRNSEGYLDYLDLMVRRIQGVGINLNDTDRTLFAMIRKAKPDPAPWSDYQVFEKAWQERYIARKNKFPRPSTTEQELMKYLQEARPVTRDQARPQDREDRVHDPLQRLLAESPAVVADAIAADNYRHGARWVEIVESLHRRLRQDVSSQNDPDLDSLLQRLENL